MLVVGAGLLIHSFLRVLDVNLGFQPEHAVTLRVDPTSNYDTKAKVNAYFLDLLQRVDQIPGVSAAGISDALPYGTNRTWGAGIKGVQYKPEDYPFAFIGIVSPGYFKAMGIPVIRGRVFEMNDPVPPQIDVKDGNYQHDAYCVINEIDGAQRFRQPGSHRHANERRRDGDRHRGGHAASRAGKSVRK